VTINSHSIPAGRSFAADNSSIRRLHLLPIKLSISTIGIVSSRLRVAWCLLYLLHFRIVKTTETQTSRGLSSIVGLLLNTVSYSVSVG